MSKYVDEIIHELDIHDGGEVLRAKHLITKAIRKAQRDVLSVDIWDEIISVPWIEGTHRHVDVEKVLEVIQNKINQLKKEAGDE